MEDMGGSLLVYLYDASGSPIGMQYRNRIYDMGAYDTFWFEKNLQGDIVAVYDAAGTKLISYTYDAWGNFVTTYHNDCTASDPANFNPYRYRSYYYDAELGMYYLQSRYYDPVVGRFISADKYISTGYGFAGCNMFAYCNNNPISYVDPDGENTIALQAWSVGMSWLPFVDTVLPIGDIIYVGGLVILGGIALYASECYDYDEALEVVGGGGGSPSPNNDDEDDYYDDESNFGGRKKIGVKRGKTPTNNQAQNRQFKQATQKLGKAAKQRVHQEVQHEGLGYHEIAEVAKDFCVLIVMWLWDAE